MKQVRKWMQLITVIAAVIVMIIVFLKPSRKTL